MPQSSVNSGNIGFFGKLPTNGDFIHRNLSANFVNPWDHWLQNGLASYQAQDPENWLNNYLTSPIWRFFLPPALFDEHAYFGILAPSVDSVGRYFPLTFAAPLPVQHAGSVMTEPFQNILALLEDSFLTHLHGSQANLLSVEQDLSVISSQLQSLLAKQSLEALPENLDSHQFIIANDTRLSEAASCLWLSGMIQRHSNTSIWWTRGSQTMEPSLLFSQGLPNKQQFSAMLSHFQDSSGWRRKHLVSARMSDKELLQTKSQLTTPQPEQTKIVSEPESPPTYPPTELESEDAISSHDILSNIQTSDIPSSQSDARMPSTTTNFNIQSYGFSDVGNKRSQNQDAILASDNNRLWLVADGMGGHYDGDKASQEIVKQLAEKVLPAPLFAKVDAIKQTIQNVNAEIFAYAQENRLTCGSTVVLITLENDKATFLWAGDSRLYLWRNGALSQLSSDHSMFNLYRDSGLSTENIKNNAITRAVGVDEEIKLDSGHLELMKGDRLMLCSDGLHDPAGDENIAYALSLNSPQDAASNLKDLVLAGEAKDNLSGVFIWL